MILASKKDSTGINSQTEKDFPPDDYTALQICLGQLGLVREENDQVDPTHKKENVRMCTVKVFEWIYT